jgi:hypothetical protein
MAKKARKPTRVKVDRYTHKKSTVKAHTRDFPDPSSYPRTGGKKKGKKGK